jgi:MarR family transcriptional regulator, organic hydroperoxide resistance regulator
MKPSQAPADRFVLNPVLDFLRLLWWIEHGLQRTSKRMESEWGITGPQRLVLRVVDQFPGVSPSELAHIVRLHPSTITGIVQRLVSGGLLDRQTHPGDSRRAQLRLKPQAARYTGLSTGTIEDTVRQALRHVGSSHVRTARVVLEEIAQRLNEPDRVSRAHRRRKETATAVRARNRRRPARSLRTRDDA